MKDNAKKHVIVGAGIAGLTLAYLLTRDGHDVLLVEKADRVGGLARSFCSGDFVFDIGPHRFHSENPAVNELVREVLAEDTLDIGRSSGVHMFGSYFDWPLDFSAIFKLPRKYLAPVACDLVLRKRRNSGNFEDYIVGKYGRTLYEIFFRPYTEKFLLRGCPDISADWAVTGIERAVIDKKAGFDDLLSLATNLFRPKPDTRFIYPEGGMQVFCDKVAAKVRCGGGRIVTSAEVERLVRADGAVTGVVVGGETFPCDRLVWTAPVNALLALLGEEAADLNYLSLVLYNYRIKGAPRLDYQWCYYGSDAVPFNRISIPTLFDPALAPAGASGLCVEMTCMAGDERWREPERQDQAIRASLAACNVIASPADVLGCDTVRIENAYPIYDMGYRQKLEAALEKVKKCRNVQLLGRTGSFWYNNMDHSIEAALRYHGEAGLVAARPVPVKESPARFLKGSELLRPAFSET